MPFLNFGGKCGSQDPDPDTDPRQNEMDPKRCLKVCSFVTIYLLTKASRYITFFLCWVN